MLNRARLWTLGASLGLLFWGGSAAAAPLNITLDPSPDLFITSGTTDYEFTVDPGAANILRLAGQPLTYFLASSLCDPTACQVSNTGFADFRLRADLDDNGNLISGTVSIDGTILTLLYGGGPLLTGTLTAFGFDAATPGLPFEFEFTVTGGSAAGDYAGGTASIIWDHDSSFSGSFTSDFSGFASSGHVGVPEPSALVLVATGLVGLVARRRRSG